MSVFPIYLAGLNQGDASWQPSDLATLFAWYDASDASTITESGGEVSQLDDKEAAFDIAQGTGSEQPTTGTRTINSLNVLDFDGNDNLELVSTFSLGTDDYSVISVAQSDLNTVILLLSLSEGTTTGGRGLQLNKNTNIYTSIVWHAGGAETLNHSDGGAPTDVFMHSVVVDFGATVKSYLNGDDEKSASLSTASLNVNTIGVGKWYVNTSNRWNGAKAEMIICNSAISVDDRQKAEGYLAHKWGLTAKLPIGHPYKSVAP